ncbi:hypothetical protein EPUS_02303 [Endocarpon pusillum Z07020]|uniref:Uncharacterized protein n=1 Tax=Endocarpon pusillum (strain Z07020 / HMAS-L-300199) TaxID=1263415 RepID=U1I3W6_ENDPU|nr:uncharacterized protein EPUS_02303 [Endocarpon pusillum Z07020]ERF76764.1 hypothetical protein EPUS_02303 [Endocarpon pusillum Z07020]
MPSVFLLYQRQSEASANLQTRSASPRLAKSQIALVAVFSALILGVMIFCLYRFCPGLAWRRRRKSETDPPSTNVKHTFLDVDDGKTLTEKCVASPETKQTFLHVDEDRSLSDKKGLRIDMHPAMRSLNGQSKRKHGSKRNESLDSTSSVAPLISRSDTIPISPERTYSPRIYSPKTPPPVPGAGTEVRVSPRRTRPLPTPVQPVRRTLQEPSRHDISPLHSSATLPSRSQLPMSFLIEIDAKREDQAAGRSQTVSPLQNPTTPISERLLSDSQLSSRNVSPISAPSTTPVITYPSATPVYLPRPFSKYNPYRSALEPASSKNWPLENMAIPEHSAVNDVSPVRKHLIQSTLKAPGTTSSTEPTTNPSTTESDKENAKPEKPAAASITHPELDTLFLEDFHRRRQQQKKAKEEQQKQKRKAELEKARAQEAAAATTVAVNSTLRPAKRFPAGGAKEKGIIPPPNRVLFPPSSSSGSEKNRAKGGRKSPEKEKEKKLKKQERPGQGLPPRLPSKSRKPSQSPGAYEKARRISGLHELVGSSSMANRG